MLTNFTGKIYLLLLVFSALLWNAVSAAGAQRE